MGISDLKETRPLRKLRHPSLKHIRPQFIYRPPIISHPGSLHVGKTNEPHAASEAKGTPSPFSRGFPTINTSDSFVENGEGAGGEGSGNHQSPPHFRTTVLRR